MMYAYIENGEIIETKNKLPKSFKDVSNHFDDLPEEKLKEYGWYVVEEDIVTFDNDWDNITEEFEFKDNKVSLKKVKTDLDLDYYKTWRTIVLENKAREVIQDKYSVQDQLNIALGIIKDVDAVKFIKDVNELKEIRKNQIKSSNSHSEVKDLSDEEFIVGGVK